MKASQIIAESFLCRQAARNIYPQDPEELFNTVWLKFAEKEIQDPSFNPADPKRYFLKAMKNQVIDWKRESQRKLSNESNIFHVLNFNIDTDLPQYKPLRKLREQAFNLVDISDGQSNSPGKAYIDEWINTPTDDEDLLFLKNILTLALNCRRNNEVIKMIGISHRQYYEYKKLAKERLYADYHASNIGDLSSLDLV